MRGLTYQERRVLVIDPSAEGERISDSVFGDLIRNGRGFWGSECFEATEMGLKALRVCPSDGNNS